MTTEFEALTAGLTSLLLPKSFDQEAVALWGCTLLFVLTFTLSIPPFLMEYTPFLQKYKIQNKPKPGLKTWVTVSFWVLVTEAFVHFPMIYLGLFPFLKFMQGNSSLFVELTIPLPLFQNHIYFF